MIITVGALFLMDQNSALGFDRSWPVLLLVAGLFSFLSTSASIEGHVQPYGAMPLGQPGHPQPAYGQPGYVPPGTVPANAPVTDPQASPSTSTHNDTQVNS